MKIRNGLTTGLILSSFILAFSICGFFFGYQLCGSYVKESRNIGLIIFVGAFFSAIISIIFIVKCKIKLDILIDYGNPVYLAADKIKEIIHQVNVYGIENLSHIIESAMKDKIIDAAKDE